jgi:hypothetical protein
VAKGVGNVTHIRRKASLDTSKIIVDHLETKKKLLDIGEVKGESLKQTIIRLTEKEHENLGGK